MTHHWATRDALLLFDVIVSTGHYSEGARELSGIKAWHDYDGYTCWLSFKDLTLTITFHGGLLIECDHKQTRDEFDLQGQRLLASRKARR
ncbi:DUF3081 family protein [Vibrio ulleungensis]|uniref:DUF3081 family protein n=1 Tax=Vibrio ulleungensis TaxID=2807619 RepID=A0ABS2HJF5_9VIBR|nr:DUF3081 family protein [Vibrio ulleungensis]MBM7037159.1 DUF3081 family protein [Vibrio ulleungensis]